MERSYTELHIAAMENNVEKCMELLDRTGIDVDVLDHAESNGIEPAYSLYHTPLYVAARHGNIDVCEFLLEKGARVDKRTFSGETPLHAAARSDSIRVAALLLSYGANIHEKCNFQGRWNTPLDVAKECKQERMIKFLTEKLS